MALFLDSALVDEARQAAARAAGLTRVHIGNRHLLSRDY